MAAMLAHEVKNPLSGIRGAAQLLEKRVETDGRILTQLICDETDRIVGLVNRMEMLSDERPAPMSPVNIHEVLNHVRRLPRPGFAAMSASARTMTRPCRRSGAIGTSWSRSSSTW